MTDLTTLARQFPCPELQELTWRCPIKYDTGAGQLSMFAQNAVAQFDKMGWKKLEKVALEVEADVFRFEEGGDMVVRILTRFSRLFLLTLWGRPGSRRLRRRSSPDHRSRVSASVSTGR